jgi:hypothetical protein
MAIRKPVSTVISSDGDFQAGHAAPARIRLAAGTPQTASR